MRLLSIALAVAFGALSLVPSLSPETGALSLTPTAAAQQVNGLSVGIVRHDRGSFEGDRSGWVEKNAAGEVSFRFDEIGRDEWSVYLRDRSRNVRLQLDLWRKQINYAAGDDPMRPLYAITGVSGSGDTTPARPQPPQYDTVAPRRADPGNAAKLFGPFSLRNAQTGLYLANRGGRLAAGQNPADHSAGWLIEPVGSERPPEFVRLKSRVSGDYLHLQNAQPQIGGIEPGWWSAMWVMDNRGDRFTFRNRWKEDHVIQVARNGQVMAQAAVPRSATAHWILAATPPDGGGQGQAAAEPVTLTVQNFSRAPVDIFVEDPPGDLGIVETLAPNQEIDLPTPPGLTWRFAQGEEWLGGIIASNDPRQVIPIGR
jgi:hypothetical protein